MDDENNRIIYRSFYEIRCRRAFKRLRRSPCWCCNALRLVWQGLWWSNLQGYIHPVFFLTLYCITRISVSLRITRRSQRWIQQFFQGLVKGCRMAGKSATCCHKCAYFKSRILNAHILIFPDYRVRGEYVSHGETNSENNPWNDRKISQRGKNTDKVKFDPLLPNWTFRTWQMTWGVIAGVGLKLAARFTTAW